MHQTNQLNVFELRVGGLYYSDTTVGGYETIPELKRAIECHEKMWTMLQVMPPILLNNKEEFMILEKIMKPNSEKVIIKYITTDQQVGYSEFKKSERVFHDPIFEKLKVDQFEK